LELARRELAERLHLDLVDDGVEDVLTRAVARAAEDADDHALVVLVGLVAETDRAGLPMAPELVGEDRRVEVERVHRGMTILLQRRRDHSRPRSRTRSTARLAISRSPLYASSRGASSSGSQRVSATSWACSSGMSPRRPRR